MQDSEKVISRTRQALMAQGGIAIAHGYYLMRLKSLTGMPVFEPHSFEERGPCFQVPLDPIRNWEKRRLRSNVRSLGSVTSTRS